MGYILGQAAANDFNAIRTHWHNSPRQTLLGGGAQAVVNPKTDATIEITGVVDAGAKLYTGLIVRYNTSETAWEYFEDTVLVQAANEQNLIIGEKIHCTRWGDDGDYALFTTDWHTLKVKESDGSPTIDHVETLILDADDFTLSVPSGVSTEALVNTKGFTGIEEIVTSVTCIAGVLTVVTKEFTYRDGLLKTVV